MLVIPTGTLVRQYSEICFTEIVRNKTVHFCLQKNVQSVPDFRRITSVSVVPFVARNVIMATRLARGVDIPGGHTEPIDNGPVGTALREAREEAAIDLALPLHVVGVISSDYQGAKPEDATYMLIIAGRVSSVQEFIPKFEAIGREQLQIEDFLQQYTAGSHEMMAELLHRAKGIADELFRR